MSDLYLRQIAVGPMQNFAYLLGSKSARECVVVDPAWDVDALRAAAAADGMRITGAVVTHFHPDHCGGHLWGHDIQGGAELVAAERVPIYAHTDEVEGLIKITGLSRSDIKPCRGGDTLTIGGVDVKLIHTPGHTPGSQCLLCEGQLVTGDTLFITGCGRTDLPGGDGRKLEESLSHLARLPAATVVYPGHHYDPQEHLPLGQVVKLNPYLKAAASGSRAPTSDE